MHDAAREIALTESLTDLITALILVPLLLILSRIDTEKKQEKRQWIIFLSLLCGASLFGFIAHYFFTGELAYRLIWIPLYPLLFATANAFLFLGMTVSSGGSRPTRTEKRFILLLSGLILLPTIGLWVFHGINTIFIFTFYALALAVKSFVLLYPPAFRERRRGLRLIYTILIPLLPCVVFQVIKKPTVRLIFMFNHNGLTHLCLIISMLLLFAAACRSLKKQ